MAFDDFFPHYVEGGEYFRCSRCHCFVSSQIPTFKKGKKFCQDCKETTQ